MNIEIIDLRLFVKIAECGNLTLGARQAFLSPPAASARIKSLEENTGQQLLFRGNKGVSLTTAGEVLFRNARLVLRQMEFLVDEMLNAETGHIRIQANTTAVTEFLPEILATFLKERPSVNIDLQESLTHDIIRNVLDGTTDLGIISGEIDNPNLEAIRFSTDRLMLAVPHDHPLNKKDSVRFRQTLSYEHISLHEGSTLLDFLRRQFRRDGYDRNLRFQVRSFEAMCRVIEAGVGIGVVPESAARRHLQTMNIKLLGLNDKWAIRDRSVLVRSRSALPSSAQSLIDSLIAAGAGGGKEPPVIE